jgi:hypothetical protein
MKHPTPDPLKSHLSTARRQLLILMARVNFGRIESFAVIGGEPALNDPEIRVYREVKLGGDAENGARPEVAEPDFKLKAQVLHLFAQFDQLQDGRVEVLHVRHGLPFSMEVRERR